jgi:hypothetical protein
MPFWFYGDFAGIARFLRMETWQSGNTDGTDFKKPDKPRTDPRSSITNL